MFTGGGGRAGPRGLRLGRNEEPGEDVAMSGGWLAPAAQSLSRKFANVGEERTAFAKGARDRVSSRGNPLLVELNCLLPAVLFHRERVGPFGRRDGSVVSGAANVQMTVYLAPGLQGWESLGPKSGGSDRDHGRGGSQRGVRWKVGGRRRKTWFNREAGRSGSPVTLKPGVKGPRALSRHGDPSPLRLNIPVPGGQRMVRPGPNEHAWGLRAT